MSKIIMLVDDNPEILSLYALVFKRKGYETLKAENSETALAMLEEASPDLFVLDVMMPEVNGIELCERIRAMPQHEQTPILILSAFSDSDTVGQSFAAGANDYLIKPIEPPALDAKIDELLKAAQE